LYSVVAGGMTGGHKFKLDIDTQLFLKVLEVANIP
jgi:hypothetical protein